MRLNKIFAGAAIATVTLLMASASNAAVAIASFAQGWVNDDGQANGASNGNNAYTGNSGGDRYNSWAAFYIPTGVFTSADLSVLASAYNNHSADQIKMYSVTTSYNTLSHSWGGTSAFNDLGAGSLYGLANMLNGLTNTTLGGTALADINASAGSIFIVGFTNATTNGQSVYSTSGVYTNGGQAGHPVLTLGTSAVPEPATWAMMIAGFGMAGVSLRRRRSALATA